MSTTRKEFLLQGALAASGTLLLLSGAADAAAPAAIDGTWRIVPGSDRLEQLAAADLQALLAAERGVTLPAPAGVSGKAGRRILIGTVRTHPEIAREHKARPFRVSETDPETCHLAYRGGDLYVVGGGPKGAMNGAFRLLARENLAVAGLDDALAPAFALRVGGHKNNQTPPPDWSEDEQARYFARHGINVVWGEKQGSPLSYEARKKYDLGLMVEVRFPPGGGERMDDPALADAVYYEKPNTKRRGLDPFHPAGRAVYLAAFKDALTENPDIRVLYGVFADYNAVPGDGSTRVSDGHDYGHTRGETILEILRVMREAIGDRPIVPTAWLWHAFFGDDKAEAAFMEKAAAAGYGLLMNEAGNADNWLIRRDNFSPTMLKTGPDGKSAWGDHYLSLVSAGGACESINPVIGMPLPYVAAHKIERLAQAKVRNVCLWWGSAEGWIYDSNMKAIAELFWKPVQDPNALMEFIARRDFGPAVAPDVLRFWKDMDAALPTTHGLYRGANVQDQGDPNVDGLRLYDWWQRMGIFTELGFGGHFYYELTPTKLATVKDLGNRGWWGVSDYANENYGIVLGRLNAATDRLAAVAARPNVPPLVRSRLGDMLTWTTLYTHLLRSQYNFDRAIGAFQSVLPQAAVRPKGSPTDEEAKATQDAALAICGDPGVKAKLAPIVQDELANLDALIALTSRMPVNFNIGAGQGDAFHGKWTREKELGMLRAKADAMRAYLGGTA